MVQTKYIDTTDDLEICFEEYETPIVKQLSNGIDFEFTDDYNLSKIVLPKFCHMIQRQYPPNTIFKYERTVFDKNHATIIINVNGQSIKVKLDLSELDK